MIDAINEVILKASAQIDNGKTGINNFRFSLTSEDLKHFTDIEYSGYKAPKIKQLYKHYWNSELDQVFVSELKSNGIAIRSLNNILKPSGKAFCMNRMRATTLDNLLTFTIKYNTLDLNRAFLADLWLFNIELNKIAKELDFKSFTIKFIVELARVQTKTFIAHLQPGYRQQNPKYKPHLINCKKLFKGLSKTNPSLTTTIVKRWLNCYIPETRTREPKLGADVDAATVFKRMTVKQRQQWIKFLQDLIQLKSL